MYWDPQQGFVDTPIYEFSLLRSGNQIHGPAIVEAAQTTYVIAPGWKFTADKWRSAMIESLTAKGVN